MTQQPIYTKAQTLVLVLLRWSIGLHFLYEGLQKLIFHGWSSKPFLLQSKGPFAFIFNWIASNEPLIPITDFINIWAQIIIGLGLILGLYVKFSAYGGALLLFLYYIAMPPFIDGPSWIDKNLIEFLAILVVGIFPTSHIIGMDRFLYLKKRKARL